MDLDKKTILYTGLFCLVTLLLSVLTLGIKGMNIFPSILKFLNCDTWLEFVSNLSLGLFCSGVLVIFGATISAQYKFKNSVNNMLHYSKVARLHYDSLLDKPPVPTVMPQKAQSFLDILQKLCAKNRRSSQLDKSESAREYYGSFSNIEKSRFLLISQKIIDSYTDFEKNYAEIEFMLFNRKYEKSIRNFCNAFREFVSPFNAVVWKNETEGIDAKDMGFYYIESQTMTKVKFYEFIYKYIDLYALWDKKMLAFIIDFDERAKQVHSGHHSETIKQIIAQRKKYLEKNI